MDRTAYLASLIGRPWQAQAEGPHAYSCWTLFGEIQRGLFGRQVPSVIFPAVPTWRWMIDTIASHEERQRWDEVQMPPGIVTACDGAGVLMARADRPAHIGTWLGIERGIIHADQTAGVIFDSVAHLRASGWGRLRFFEPVQDA